MNATRRSPVHALPAFLPPFLLALGWFYLPHPDALFTSAGAIGVETIAFTPIVTALVALAVQAIDPSMEEAGRLSAPPAGPSLDERAKLSATFR